MTYFNRDDLLRLFELALIPSPLVIRSEFSTFIIEGELIEDGSVWVDGEQFSDLQTAMLAHPHHYQATSDAWQYWTYYNNERSRWVPLEHLRAQSLYEKDQATIKTSDTHPLIIDSVDLPFNAGKLGMTFCPGKNSVGLYGGTWRRSLEKDLHALVNWDTALLVSLVEQHEFELLGVKGFSKQIKKQPFEWLHLPIADMQTPSPMFEQSWQHNGKIVHQCLETGKNLVIHCRGGLGRTGLVAGRILIELGIKPPDAVRRVREARAHAIETYAQEHYLLTQHWLGDI